MKRLFYIYISLFMLTWVMLSSCHTETPRARLERVDAMLDRVPLDTNAIMEALDSTAEISVDLSLDDSMYYALLKHDYLAKQFQRVSSDSTMRKVVRYYDKAKKPYERMRAHYILACMYYDNLKFKEAQGQCFRAVEQGDTISARGIKLTAKCYMLLGAISKRQEDHKLIRSSYEQAAHYAQMDKDSCTLADSYGHLVDYFRKEKDDDMMLKYAWKAFNMYMDLGLREDAYDELLPISEVYLNTKDYNRSKQYLEEYEQKQLYPAIKRGQVDTASLGNYYATKGKYFLLLNKIDSALVCYYSELECENDITIPGVYSDIANAYKIKGNLDSVNKYLSLYIVSHEKSDSIKSSAYLHDNFYINENNILRKQNEQLVGGHRQNAWFSVFCIVVLLLLFLFMLKMYYSIKRNPVANLGRTNYKYFFGRKIPNLIMPEKKQSVYLSIDEIKIMIAQLVNEKKPIKDQRIWDSLYFYMQAYDKNFITFLEHFSEQVSTRDMHMCMLIRLGYTPTELALLLLVSKQNVTKLRAKLAEILFDEDGKSSKNFDSLIRGYV